MNTPRSAYARPADLAALLSRVLAYAWASPTTLLGLLFLPPVLLIGGAKIIEGVLEIHGGLAFLFLRYLTPLRGGAHAMTLGHVVIGRDLRSLDYSRDHERVHVRQCERWGPLFIPAYLTASLVALLRGRRPYLDNAFEREAYGRSQEI